MFVNQLNSCFLKPFELVTFLKISHFLPVSVCFVLQCILPLAYYVQFGNGFIHKLIIPNLQAAEREAKWNHVSLVSSYVHQI